MVFVSGITGSSNCAVVINPNDYGITNYDYTLFSDKESDYFFVNNCTTGACYNCASGVTITSLSASSQTVTYVRCSGNTQTITLNAGATITLPGTVDLEKTLNYIGGANDEPSYKITSVGACGTRTGIRIKNTSGVSGTISYWKCSGTPGLVTANIPPTSSGGLGTLLLATVDLGSITVLSGGSNVFIANTGTCAYCP